MWKLKALLRKHENLLLILTASLALSALLLNFEFKMIEAGLYDLRVMRGSPAPADQNIVLVTLDDNTTKNLDEFTPLTLDFHARFIESLERLDPAAVGYLVDLNRVNQANPELFGGESGKRFLEGAQRLRERGTTVILGTPFDVTGEVLPPYPLSSLPHALAVIHKDGNVFAEDKVTRRALLELNDKPAFHMELARKTKLVSPEWIPPGAYTVPEIDASYFFFTYQEDTALHGDITTPFLGGYPRVSFYDVLKGKIPEGFLRGKILLVDTFSKENSGDFAFTPYSKASFSNPKLVVHANILDSIIHRRSIVRAPEELNWLITFGATVFVLWCVLSYTPIGGVLATVTLAVVFMAVSHLAFRFYGLWIRESQPLIAIFLGYYLAVPYRLIREYKKRWDYQRKNELLLQVEELKTNFMSLVTHDLKTPVARIQGLAEVLLRKAQERLQDSDKQSLHHIIHSTEELNHFISSILELSKIESNRIQLKLESRDINQLIERALESFQAPARARQITLNVSLDPLFPVKIDSSLISKVINNLIDNAIKYSGPGSQITIESREVSEADGEWIVVSVTDQGIGMSAEEQESLFTRFYRAKNDTTTRVSGTGLGLYLTRYFVELHQGRVSVQSEKNKGSTFQIKLPIHFSGISTASPLSPVPVPATGPVRPGLGRRFIELFSKRRESNA